MGFNVVPNSVLGCCLVFVAAVPTVTAVEDWSQFRGPIGGEEIGTATWPSSWSESSNIAWSTDQVCRPETGDLQQSLRRYRSLLGKPGLGLGDRARTLGNHHDVGSEATHDGFYVGDRVGVASGLGNGVTHSLNPQP